MVNEGAAAQFARDRMGLTFVPFHDEGDLRELGAIARPGFARQALVEAAQAQTQTAPPQGTRALHIRSSDTDRSTGVRSGDLTRGNASRIGAILLR